MQSGEFLIQAEAVLKKSVGKIVAQSIIANQLKRLRKDRDFLSADECAGLVPSMISALAIFATKHETELAQSELDKLVAQHVS